MLANKENVATDVSTLSDGSSSTGPIKKKVIRTPHRRLPPTNSTPMKSPAVRLQPNTSNSTAPSPAASSIAQLNFTPGRSRLDPNSFKELQEKYKKRGDRSRPAKGSKSKYASANLQSFLQLAGMVKTPKPKQYAIYQDEGDDEVEDDTMRLVSAPRPSSAEVVAPAKASTKAVASSSPQQQEQEALLREKQLKQQQRLATPPSSSSSGSKSKPTPSTKPQSAARSNSNSSSSSSGVKAVHVASPTTSSPATRTAACSSIGDSRSAVANKGKSAAPAPAPAPAPRQPPKRTLHQPQDAVELSVKGQVKVHMHVPEGEYKAVGVEPTVHDEAGSCEPEDETEVELESADDEPDTAVEAVSAPVSKPPRSVLVAPRTESSDAQPAATATPSKNKNRVRSALVRFASPKPVVTTPEWLARSTTTPSTAADADTMEGRAEGAGWTVNTPAEATRARTLLAGRTPLPSHRNDDSEEEGYDEEVREEMVVEGETEADSCRSEADSAAAGAGVEEAFFTHAVSRGSMDDDVVASPMQIPTSIERIVSANRRATATENSPGSPAYSSPVLSSGDKNGESGSGRKMLSTTPTPPFLSATSTSAAHADIPASRGTPTQTLFGSYGGAAGGGDEFSPSIAANKASEAANRRKQQYHPPHSFLDESIVSAAGDHSQGHVKLAAEKPVLGAVSVEAPVIAHATTEVAVARGLDVAQPTAKAALSLPVSTTNGPVSTKPTVKVSAVGVSSMQPSLHPVRSGLTSAGAAHSETSLVAGGGVAGAASSAMRARPLHHRGAITAHEDDVRPQAHPVPAHARRVATAASSTAAIPALEAKSATRFDSSETAPATVEISAPYTEANLEVASSYTYFNHFAQAAANASASATAEAPNAASADSRHGCSITKSALQDAGTQCPTPQGKAAMSVSGVVSAHMRTSRMHEDWGSRSPNGKSYQFDTGTASAIAFHSVSDSEGGDESEEDYSDYNEVDDQDESGECFDLTQPNRRGAENMGSEVGEIDDDEEDDEFYDYDNAEYEEEEGEEEHSRSNSYGSIATGSEEPEETEEESELFEEELGGEDALVMDDEYKSLLRKYSRLKKLGKKLEREEHLQVGSEAGDDESSCGAGGSMSSAATESSGGEVSLNAALSGVISSKAVRKAIGGKRFEPTLGAMKEAPHEDEGVSDGGSEDGGRRLEASFDSNNRVLNSLLGGSPTKSGGIGQAPVSKSGGEDVNESFASSVPTATSATTLTMDQTMDAGTAHKSKSAEVELKNPRLMIGHRKEKKHATKGDASQFLQRSKAGGASENMKELLLVSNKIGVPTTIKLQFGNKNLSKSGKKKQLVITSTAIQMRFDKYNSDTNMSVLLTSSPRPSNGEASTDAADGELKHDDDASVQQQLQAFQASPHKLCIDHGKEATLYLSFIPNAYGVYGGALKLQSNKKSYVMLIRGECKRNSSVTIATGIGATNHEIGHLSPIKKSPSRHVKVTSSSLPKFSVNTAEGEEATGAKLESKVKSSISERSSTADGLDGLLVPTDRPKNSENAIRSAPEPHKLKQKWLQQWLSQHTAGTGSLAPQLNGMDIERLGAAAASASASAARGDNSTGNAAVQQHSSSSTSPSSAAISIIPQTMLMYSYDNEIVMNIKKQHLPLQTQEHVIGTSSTAAMSPLSTANLHRNKIFESKFIIRNFGNKPISFKLFPSTPLLQIDPASKGSEASGPKMRSDKNTASDQGTQMRTVQPHSDYCVRIHYTTSIKLMQDQLSSILFSDKSSPSNASQRRNRIREFEVNSTSSTTRSAHIGYVLVSTSDPESESEKNNSEFVVEVKYHPQYLYQLAMVSSPRSSAKSNSSAKATEVHLKTQKPALELRESMTLEELIGCGGKKSERKNDITAFTAAATVATSTDGSERYSSHSGSSDSSSSGVISSVTNNDIPTLQRAVAVPERTVDATHSRTKKSSKGVYFKTSSLEFAFNPAGQPTTGVRQTVDMCNATKHDVFVVFSKPRWPFGIMHSTVRLHAKSYVQFPVIFTPLSSSLHTQSMEHRETLAATVHRVQSDGSMGRDVTDLVSVNLVGRAK